MRRAAILWVLAAGSFANTASAAVDVVLLPPVTCVRTTHASTACTYTFPGVVGPGLLGIAVEDRDHEDRDSSVTLSLNERRIVDPKAFREAMEAHSRRPHHERHHDGTIEFRVTLAATNTLTVRMAGEHRGRLTLGVSEVIATEAAAVIGPSGGTVTVNDPDSRILGAYLEIPPLALTAPVVVRLEDPPSPPKPPGESEPVSAYVAVRPAGLRLSGIARLGLPLLNPDDTRPMVVWNFDERSVTWSVLDLEDLSDGHVTALLDSFSIKVAATSSARLGSAASIAALINGNELSPASNSCWLRCKTLGPKGVALAVPNAGAITRDGTLLVWPPLDELATFALRHLQTGRSDTAVLFWLNADGWGDPGREKDVLAHPLEVADSVAKFLVQLEQSQPDLSSFYSRIGVFFDIEPVPTTLVNAYRTLLQATRNALLRNGLNEVKLAVFPTKRTATGDTDLWSDSDFLTIGSDVDLFLYGAYDYGTLLSAQIYSSKVATDLTALANIGLGPKLVPLVSTGNVTISHSGWETVGAGVDGIQASTAAQQLRGLGLFQLWGGQPGGKPLDDTGWDKLRGAFANPASWTYSDCAQGGPGEKVIFSKQMPSGRSDLFMINPDGSGGPQQLTDEAKNGHHSWRPSIFPDGKRILFERDNNLWVLNTDTHAAVSLTTDGQLGSWGYSSPSLSPDGTKIAFAYGLLVGGSCSACTTWDIYTMTIDSTNHVGPKVQITNNVYRDAEAVFSPDGTKLLITHYQGAPSSDCCNETDLYIYDLATHTETHFYGTTAYDWASDWSSAGILFMTGSGAPSFTSYFINPNGTGLHALATTPSLSYGAVFSPDRSRILFTHAPSGQLYTVSVSGGTAVPIPGATSVDIENRAATWGYIK